MPFADAFAAAVKYAADPREMEAWHRALADRPRYVNGEPNPDYSHNFDRLPRLVFADWLEENGHSATAEVVRRQQSEAEEFDRDRNPTAGTPLRASWTQYVPAGANSEAEIAPPGRLAAHVDAPAGADRVGVGVFYTLPETEPVGYSDGVRRDAHRSVGHFAYYDADEAASLMKRLRDEGVHVAVRHQPQFVRDALAADTQPEQPQRMQRDPEPPPSKLRVPSQQLAEKILALRRVNRRHQKRRSQRNRELAPPDLAAKIAALVAAKPRTRTQLQSSLRLDAAATSKGIEHGVAAGTLRVESAPPRHGGTRVFAAQPAAAPSPTLPVRDAVESEPSRYAAAFESAVKYAADPASMATWHAALLPERPDWRTATTETRREIAVRNSDRLPRHAFADWLEESGYPAYSEIVRRHLADAEAVASRRGEDDMNAAATNSYRFSPQDRNEHDGDDIPDVERHPPETLSADAWTAFHRGRGIHGLTAGFTLPPAEGTTEHRHVYHFTTGPEAEIASLLQRLRDEGFHVADTRTHRKLLAAEPTKYAADPYREAPPVHVTRHPLTGEMKVWRKTGRRDRVVRSVADLNAVRRGYAGSLGSSAKYPDLPADAAVVHGPGGLFVVRRFIPTDPADTRHKVSLFDETSGRELASALFAPVVVADRDAGVAEAVRHAFPTKYAAYRAPRGGMAVKGVYYPGGELVPDLAKFAAGDAETPRERAKRLLRQFIASRGGRGDSAAEAQRLLTATGPKTAELVAEIPTIAEKSPRPVPLVGSRPLPSRVPETGPVKRIPASQPKSSSPPVAAATPTRPSRPELTPATLALALAAMNGRMTAEAFEAALRGSPAPPATKPADDVVPLTVAPRKPPGLRETPRRKSRADSYAEAFANAVGGGGSPLRYAADPQQHAAFHAALRDANELDTLPSLVYADWLEENGYPAHAEIVRRHQQRAGEHGTRAVHIELVPTDDRRPGGASVDSYPTTAGGHVVGVQYLQAAPGSDRTTLHRHFVRTTPEDAHRLASQLEDEGVADADLARVHIERRYPHLATAAEPHR